MNSASAAAHPNIAFIKYWGNRDDTLRLPANGSVSMNLAALETRTHVLFREELASDIVLVNETPMVGAGLARVSRFMDNVRVLAGIPFYAEIHSENNFPMGAGIASSAAAFAALALAAGTAAGLSLSEAELSRLARLGSGSASRSIPEGYCEWLPGSSDEDSISVSLAPASHWALTDLIAVVSHSHKKVGSGVGHQSAGTSPYQAARVADAPNRVENCRRAILEKDFDALAEVSERDCILMHAVMMTQNPPLFYWEGPSIDLMKRVTELRADGVPCFYTLDAGPNVHVICPESSVSQVREMLLSAPGVEQVLSSGPGGKAYLL